MDGQRPEADLRSELSDLRERLARMEERQQGTREIAHMNHESLQEQIDDLRSAHRSTGTQSLGGLGMTAWIKLGLAALLPFLVFMNLLSPERATRAAQIIGGP